MSCLSLLFVFVLFFATIFAFKESYGQNSTKSASDLNQQQQPLKATLILLNMENTILRNGSRLTRMSVILCFLLGAHVNGLVNEQQVC
ncbi:hypothetical protein L596_017682 [Steinernema carpocapsae]|uniref:Secreted protein n=1 Tax=Steinernema carpocapsae TaxID=34508 RepID=A0A4U5N338_STECR|nr:hypothetical protein L596_017682 [Steinernema carpocapsae]